MVDATVTTEFEFVRTTVVQRSEAARLLISQSIVNDNLQNLASSEWYHERPSAITYTLSSRKTSSMALSMTGRSRRCELHDVDNPADFVSPFQGEVVQCQVHTPSRVPLRT